jgi:aminoglycoside/choline kinase family phosphotransferase
MMGRLDLARHWVQEPLGVQDVDLQPASSDASFRRYFRVRTPDATLILMDAPAEKEDCRPFIAVNDLLSQAGVHVPKIHGRNLDAGFLLLEDLGTRCYMDELNAGNASALYGDAFESLLAMQSRVPAHAVPTYDRSLVMTELSLFSDWFLGRHLGVDGSNRTGEILSSSFRFLAERFDEQEKVFVHRDFHSRNLMRTGERNPGVLDFQDAVAGPAVYDAISLMRDVYIDWPPDRVEAWLRDYHRDALANRIPVSADPDVFLRTADLIGAQRHLKIAGIFCRLYYRDAKPDYLRDISLTLRYLLDECERQPELVPLRDMLEDLNVMARSNEKTLQQLGDAEGREP